MRIQLLCMVLVMAGLSSITAADELKVDRKICTQPEYASEQPKYCLLVFGPKADTRVWLVLDLAYDPLKDKPGKTESLHVDRNGNGNLTDPGERIPVTVVTKKEEIDFGFQAQASILHLPRFEAGDISSSKGTVLYKNLVVDVDWFIFGRKDREVNISVDVPGYGRQSVGGEQLWFSDSPEKAPVIWFDGARSLRRAPSGLLHLPVDYTGKTPPAPWYEEFPLVRGQTMPISVEIGSPGIGLGTFNVFRNDLPPEDVYPVAKIVFPHADPDQPPIEVTVPLRERCCGVLFKGVISVPSQAALGQAPITFSFPDWREGDVKPISTTIEVSDQDRRPKIFRED